MHQLAQLGHDGAQNREGPGREFADDAVEPPGGALPHDLMTERGGLPHSVKAAVVNDHEAAPDRHRHIGPEQMGPAAHPVGRVGQRQAQGACRPAVRRRNSEDEMGFGKHNGRYPLVHNQLK